MKRPMVAVAGAYAAGLLLAEFFQPALPVLLVASAALWLAAVLLAKQRRLLLWPLLFALGWTSLTTRTAVVSAADLRLVMGTNNALVTVRGTLRETPSQRVFERGETEVWRSLAEVRVTELRRGGEWQPAYGTVMTSTSGQLPPEYFNGQPVEVAGILLRPPQPIAEGLFDYRSYLNRQGIYFQLKCDSPADWKLREGAATGLPLSDRFLTWAQRTLARGLPKEARDQPLELLWAMTLGWRPALTNEVSEPFMRSGTMHIFAISGLHIALIAGILVAVLRVARVPRAWCGLVVIPLIWFYTGATGWQSSAVRSTVMMSIIVGGWALRRPSDLINSLMAAAFVILVFDPQQLFQASFQLSFFVVLSLALLLPPLHALRDRLLQYDPWLPPTLIPRWKRWLSVPVRWVVTAFATSLAAWLGSLLLTAYYFHLFSPVALLANLVVVPISSGALACNLASLICGDGLPWLGEVFNHAGWACMWLMVWASVKATELPGAFCYVPMPGLVEFLIYYGLLIGALSGWLFAKARWRWSVTAVTLVLFAYGANCWRTRGEVKLTILPLNGGSAVHLDRAGRANDWLVDCGNTNAVEFVTKPFLRAQGVNHLPRVALSHGDVRYVGGFSELELLFGVNEVYTSAGRFRSPVYRRLMLEMEKHPERHKLLARGDQSGPWHVLHPDPADKFPQGDDLALVLRGDFHGTRVLLLSDLGRPGQEALLERELDLRADIVVTGLPEQGEPLNGALLAAVQPKVIIVADSEYPATRRASAKLTERLAANGRPVFYTRSSGAVTLAFHTKGWQLRAMDGTEGTSASVSRTATELRTPAETPTPPDNSER